MYTWLYLFPLSGIDIPWLIHVASDAMDHNKICRVPTFPTYILSLPFFSERAARISLSVRKMQHTK
jgi:hypothetical protein